MMAHQAFAQSQRLLTACNDGYNFMEDFPIPCSHCSICYRSHNFLNQKPWHPLNFRNQMKVFEAQEQAEKEAKAKAQGKVTARLKNAFEPSQLP